MNADNNVNSESEEEIDPAVIELPWWKNWKIMLPIWGLILAFIGLGIHYKIDAKLIASGVFLIGLLSNAFAWKISSLSN